MDAKERAEEVQAAVPADSATGKREQAAEKNDYWDWTPPEPAWEPLPNRILALLSDKNPLYLVSAALILYAQTVIFKTDNLDINTAVPVVIMAIYCALLTGAAVLIVKAGLVWDDARSIFVILALLFMVMSAAADGLVINAPAEGRLSLAACLGVSIGLAEATCAALKIGVPRPARVFFYALLALFYIYPCVMSELVSANEGDPAPAIRGIMLFPVAAALVFMILTPLVAGPSRGFEEREGMTAGFPKILLAVFAAGVIFRAYLLSISFHGAGGAGPYSSLESGFGGYILTPFLLCLGVLFLERALRGGGKTAMRSALIFPLLIPVSGLMVPDNGAAVQFLQAVPFGASPLQATVFLAVLFYAYAWFRRLPGAAAVFNLLLFGAVAGRICLQGARHADMSVLEWIPAWVVVIFMAVTAFRRRSSLIFIAAGALAVVCLTAACWDTAFTRNSGFVPANLLGLVFCAGGILFKDRFAAVLNYMGAWTVSIFWLVFMFSLLSNDILPYGWPFKVLYPAAILLATFAGWRASGGAYKRAAVAMLVMSAGVGIVKLRELFTRLDFPGAELVFWGMAAFAAAVAVSLRKGGVFRRLRELGVQDNEDK